MDVNVLDEEMRDMGLGEIFNEPKPEDFHPLEKEHKNKDNPFTSEQKDSSIISRDNSDALKSHSRSRPDSGNMEYADLHIRLPKRLLFFFKYYCSNNHVSMRDCVTSLIEDIVKKNKKSIVEAVKNFSKQCIEYAEGR